MKFFTMGNKNHPAILFFHAMGVSAKSSIPVAMYLKDDYYCIMPSSSVYCKDQRYISKEDEVKQVKDFLKKEGISHLALVVASSIGADLAMAFLTTTPYKVDHVFFDGGQFAQIPKMLRSIMTPFLYLAIKSLAWSKGRTLKYILWCDDEAIKPYFIEAGQGLTYHNLRMQLSDSLVKDAFPSLSKKMQEHTFFEFGSIEDHYKYRDAVMKAYPNGNYPVFDQYNHMQYQIRDPKGFARMLISVMKENQLPDLPFMK